jgi:AcrR family transcriptional regulator
MPRPLEFDREAVLEKCMLQFWENGYDQTSIGDLEIASGIKRTSLYNSFESKDALFQSAIEYFIETKCVYWTSILLEPDCYVTGVDNLLSTMIRENFDPNHPTGCLITYSAAGIDSHSEEIRAAIRQGHEITLDGLKTAIRKAMDAGNLRPDIDIDTLALFTLNSFQGTMVLSKTIGSEASLAKVKDTVLEAIKLFCK